MRKPRTLINRIRTLEESFQRFRSLIPHLKDCIIVTKLLLDKGVLTRKDIENEYENLKQLS